MTMGFHYSMDGTLTIPRDREPAAIAAIAAALDDEGAGPAASLEEALLDVFDADVVELVDAEIGEYRFSGYQKWHAFHDEVFAVLAEFGWGSITCRGDDSIWKVVLTGGTKHDLPGITVFDGEADLTADVDPYTITNPEG